MWNFTYLYVKAPYIEELCEAVYREIVYYNRPDQGRRISDKLREEDKIVIADKVHAATGNKMMWQALTVRHIGRETRIDFALYREEIDRMLAGIDPKLYGNKPANFAALKNRSYEHAYEHLLASGGKGVSSRARVEILIGRALYELSHLRLIKEELVLRSRSASDSVMSVEQRLSLDVEAELIAKARGYELERMALEKIEIRKAGLERVQPEKVVTELTEQPGENLRLYIYADLIKDKVETKMAAYRERMNELAEYGQGEAYITARRLIEHELCYGRDHVTTAKYRQIEQAAAAELRLGAILNRAMPGTREHGSHGGQVLSPEDKSMLLAARRSAANTLEQQVRQQQVRQREFDDIGHKQEHRQQVNPVKTVKTSLLEYRNMNYLSEHILSDNRYAEAVKVAIGHTLGQINRHKQEFAAEQREYELHHEKQHDFGRSL